VYRAVSPFVWLNLVTVIYFKADLILFEFLGLPKAEAGQYGVAYRLIEAVILLSSPIGLMLFRQFRQTRFSTTRVLREIAPSVFMAMAIGIALAVILWFFGGRLINLAYGVAYHSAGDLLMVLGCSLVFILPNGVLTQAALACGLEKWFAISASIAAVVNILGNLLLIPMYGVVAAAWMTVLTEAVLGASVALGMRYGRPHTLLDTKIQ
jgi:O-antigen/teichoic acid export membrane protein